ncbi:MAG: hypothetical protein ABW213_13835 [Tardiphaga sp.]
MKRYVLTAALLGIATSAAAQTTPSKYAGTGMSVTGAASERAAGQSVPANASRNTGAPSTKAAPTSDNKSSGASGFSGEEVNGVNSSTTNAQ